MKSKVLFFSLLPVGIEPTLHPPQGCVLSIERRELISNKERILYIPSLYERRTENYLESAVARLVRRDFMRAAVFFLMVPFLAALSIVW